MNDKITLTMLLKKMPSLMFGLLLYAVGILSTLYSNLGMSPWDVFHMGIVNHTPLLLGQVNQLTGLFILLISYFLGIVPGLASIMNMFFIGFFIDLINPMGIFHTPGTVAGRLLLLLFGIITIGWATYFYLRVELGAGPRDSFMEGLVRKLNKPVWMIRAGIEITVLILGYLMGGPVGVGTLITAGLIGFAVQFAFRIGRYDSKEAKHVDLIQLYKTFAGKNDAETQKDLP